MWAREQKGEAATKRCISEPGNNWVLIPGKTQHKPQSYYCMRGMGAIDPSSCQFGVEGHSRGGREMFILWHVPSATQVGRRALGSIETLRQRNAVYRHGHLDG